MEQKFRVSGEARIVTEESPSQSCDAAGAIGRTPGGKPGHVAVELSDAQIKARLGIDSYLQITTAFWDVQTRSLRIYLAGDGLPAHSPKCPIYCVPIGHVTER